MNTETRAKVSAAGGEGRARKLSAERRRAIAEAAAAARWGTRPGRGRTITGTLARHSRAVLVTSCMESRYVMVWRYRAEHGACFRWPSVREMVGR